MCRLDRCSSQYDKFGIVTTVLGIILSYCEDEFRDVDYFASQYDKEKFLMDGFCFAFV